MNRDTVRNAHIVAAMTGTCLIALFWVGTVGAELLGTSSEVARVKLAVATAVPLLVASFAVAGISGQRLAGRSQGRLVRRKQARMAWMAGLGIAVLTPSAIALAILASYGETTSTRFVVLQVIELAAGAINLSLSVLQIRAGRRLRPAPA
ncbi:MAG: hypothetical protein AAFQ82_15735 [Myxococcota bacterium]